MNDVNVPQKWTDLILKIRTEFPSAIIAGGALRDYFNDVDVKDIDVFIPASEYAGKLHVLNKWFGYETNKTDIENEYKKKKLLEEVFEFYPHGFRNPLQIIIVNSDKTGVPFIGEQIARFDITVCRIAYDGHRLYFEPSYYMDNEDKILRIENPWNIESSLNRLDRISTKYSGWKLIDHEGKEREHPLKSVYNE